MAAGLTITRTLPLFPNGVFLQWDLTPPLDDGTYIVNVYRGGGPEGPWELISSDLPDAFNYIDRLPTVSAAPPYTVADPNQLSMLRELHYRVVATSPSGQESAAVSTVEPKLDGRQKLLKRKFLRDEAVMLRKLNGVDVAIAKKKRWGPRCTKCFDKYTKEIIRGNCTACYGTGFTGGYHDPLITLARRGTMQKGKQLTAQGDSELKSTTVTILDLPKVEADDLLVFLHDNRRFIVKEVAPTELKTVTVHQRLVVAELPRSAIEYRLNVDPLRIPPLF